MLKNTFDQQKSDIADSFDDFARRIRALEATNVADFGPAFFQNLRDKVNETSEELDDIEGECLDVEEEEDDPEDIEGA